ncbi:hypothetical protein [Fuerstiella marisgermanici]|uniref:Uncharacterized protein n=1 Tax=Fuerstiella marisgermanici TaxID=1891926 RepID=A0A1P8WDX9_9PLAN|nr:hypothetical protein [Fuerstiella marisgermanici]APZ92239.1 hypothetical protein Fuma_01849 [Fuerstiella marisgermanici]
MNAKIVYLSNSADGSDKRSLFIIAETTKTGEVVILARVIQKANKVQACLVGENCYW